MKALVIGGGIAGLSAAVELVSCGVETELLEASSRLGGRIMSAKFPRSDFPPLDIGQHALSASYENLFAMLEKVGAELNAGKEENLFITFRGTNGNIASLNLPDADSVFALAREFLGLQHLTFSEKIRFARFLLFVKTAKPEKYADKTVGDLFDKFNQSEIEEKFWDKILLSLFATPPRSINAAPFLRVLQEMFFKKKGAQKIYVLNRTLEDAIIKPVANFLNAASAFKLALREKAIAFVPEGDKIASVITNNRKISDFDYVVSAVPPEKLAEILPERTKIRDSLLKFRYAPILTAYIKIRKNDLTEKAYLLPESSLDWLFNFGDYVSVVASYPQKLTAEPEREIKKRIIGELNKFFSVFSEENILDFVLLIKKKSIIMSDNLNYGLREQIGSPFSNLLIAGDWVNAVLPPVAENAVLTGFEAAKKICSLNYDSLDGRTVNNI